MLKKLRQLISNTSRHEDSDELNFNRLPVMSASEIFQQLNLYNQIRSIRRKVGIDPNRFEQMYINPIERFCELVQLMPASQAHHHAVIGGLIQHTLNVIEYAVHERQRHTLPINSEPEIIEEQKNLWTFAVFVAALTHDIGKAITMVYFIDIDTDVAVSPIATSLTKQGVKHYKLSFKPTNHYKLHEQVGAIFLGQLFDSTSLNFLAHDLDIFSEVMSYISNDRDNWGSVGAIVNQADRQSTAMALRISTETGQSRQFTGAELENFGERIMRSLRFMIDNKQLAINRPGAVLFTADSEYVYAVSKTIAERIREQMQSLGASDIPTDNNRIFDELQQQGFAESNDKDQAIFRITIQIPKQNFEQSFTCLKFRASKLFNVNNMPNPLKGSLSETDSATVETSEPVVTRDDESPQTETDSKNLKTQKMEQIYEEFEDVPAEFSAEPSENKALAVNSQKSKSKPKKQAQTVEKTPQEIVGGFFDWLYSRVENKEIIINRSGQPAYIIEKNNKKYLGIVSPFVFADYAVHDDLYQLEKELKLTRETRVLAASIIQSAIHKQKANLPNVGGQVHTYRLKTALSPKAKLSLYLFDMKDIPHEELVKIINLIDATDILFEDKT